MQTEFCKKLGIEVPIFAFTHCRDVVVAVSKAGGVGVLGAVGFSPAQLKEELDWIDEHIGDHVYAAAASDAAPLRVLDVLKVTSLNNEAIHTRKRSKERKQPSIIFNRT